VIDIINTCLEDTYFRCFFATFSYYENNLQKGIALFIYRRRIWTVNILDRFVCFRRIVAVIRPIRNSSLSENNTHPKMVFSRTRYARGLLRHFWTDYKDLFEGILQTNIEREGRSKLPARFRPLRDSPPPTSLCNWVTE
jgi:hypothetical protein